MDILFKRFYQNVSVREEKGGGCLVELDGRPLRIYPEKRERLILPFRVLAEAVAKEWERQKDPADWNDLFLTRFSMRAFSFQGKAAEDAKKALVQELLTLFEEDVLLYRVSYPEGLKRRQDREWGDVLRWFEGETGTVPKPSASLSAIPMAPEDIRGLEMLLSSFSYPRVFALSLLTRLYGSLVLALAVVRGRLSGPFAFDLSILEELYQNERWGSDFEENDKRLKIKDEIGQITLFLSFLE